MAIKGLHNVTLDSDLPKGIIKAKDLKPGQYGVVVDSNTAHGHQGRIIGRVFTPVQNKESFHVQKFFALDNPSSTWNDPNYTLRLLTPGEAITLVIGDQ